MICKSCGSVFEEYKTTEKIFKNGTKHLEARCPDCGKWIKYLPQGKDTTMWYGKYKGEKIEDIIIKDPEYIMWLKENSKNNTRRKIVIAELIQKLRATDDPKEQDKIKMEIDLVEEKMCGV